MPPLPWQIKPFDSASVTIGGEIVLTGYVEAYHPGYDAGGHNVRISGRSKTCDAIDCMPDVGAGEFSGYTLDRLARTLCAPFGIDVVVQCDVGDPLPDATLDKTETAFGFLEKMARLRSVLLTDNARGNLVLTQAGKGGKAPGALVEGENILAATARLSSNERFQQYAVLSQTPLSYDDEDAHTQIIGKATDPGCPRYRRFAEMAENPSDQSLAQKRALWRALHNAAVGVEADVTVQGFRQAGGKLWDTNLIVPVRSPMLALDRSLLTGSVEFQIREGTGRTTRLVCAPQEAFSPEPADSGPSTKGKTDDYWNGIVPVHGGGG
jgi:prophage tail gpP-like protein